MIDDTMNKLSNLLSSAIGDTPVPEIARRAGLSQWRIYAILDGRSLRPRPDALRGLAAALGIPYSTLALAAYGVDGDSEDSPPREKDE